MSDDSGGSARQYEEEIESLKRELAAEKKKRHDLEYELENKREIIRGLNGFMGSCDG